MADKLTTTQREASDVMFDLVDSQRAFTSNYGDAVSRLKRSLVSQVTITTTAGLFLGGLVGAVVGMRRR
jgi:hypothetical protein